MKARVKKDKDEEYYISCMLAAKVEISRGHTAEEDKRNSKEQKYFLQRAINKEKRREEKGKESKKGKYKGILFYIILYYIKEYENTLFVLCIYVSCYVSLLSKNMICV